MSRYTLDDFFSPEAKRAFVDREAKLRGSKKWPASRWYNDEDFCELYRVALDLHNENAKLKQDNQSLVKISKKVIEAKQDFKGRFLAEKKKHESLQSGIEKIKRQARYDGIKEILLQFEKAWDECNQDVQLHNSGGHALIDHGMRSIRGIQLHRQPITLKDRLIELALYVKTLQCMKKKQLSRNSQKHSKSKRILKMDYESLNN